MEKEVPRATEYYEDEIDLRELFKILINGKYTVLITFVLALLATVVFIKQQPVKYKGNRVLSFTSLSGSAVNMENYISQLKTERMLQLTLDETKLRDNNGEMLEPEQILNLMEINRIDETNLVEIEYSYNKASEVTKFLNSFIQISTKELLKNDKTKFNYLFELNENQLSSENRLLEDKTKQITEFLEKNGNLDELKKQISNLKAVIGSLDMELIQLNMNIKIKQETLSKLEKYIDFDKEFDMEKLKFDVNSGEILSEDSNNLSNFLTITEYTKTRNGLVNNIEARNTKQKEIKELSKQLEEKEIKLLNLDYKFKILENEFKAAQNSYNSYFLENKRIASEIEKGEVSVNVISEKEPLIVNSNKRLQLIIGAVLGLFLGVFLVFARGFIQSLKEN